jgi:hypothetical protein
MNIPRDHVNDFLTKIAHGEVIGSHDSFFNSISGNGDSDSKRRKLSESGSYTGISGSGNNGGISSADTGYGESINGSLYGSQPIWPASSNYQTEEDEEDNVVENQALERLRRAANKNQGSSNLISLTGSPAVRDPGVDNNVDGNPMMGDDMEMSEEEEGEIFDEVAQNPWGAHHNEPVTSSANPSMMFPHTQPPPSLLHPGAGGLNNGGIPSFISSSHHLPPPNLGQPTLGAPAMPVLDIPPPPFRVPPPIDKTGDESGTKVSSPWPTTGGFSLPASVMDAITPATNNFNLPPPSTPPVSELANQPSLTSFTNPPPTAAAYSAPPPNHLSRPPPPLSPTPAAVSAPPTPQVSTASVPPPGFNLLRRSSSESAASLNKFSVGSLPPSFDKKPPPVSFGAGNNNCKDNNGDNYGEDFNELEHLNNMRSGDPEALQTDNTDYIESKTDFSLGGNGSTPGKPPFRGGGGMRGRGGFTPERGGFTPDHQRGGGGGFGNRGGGGPRGGNGGPFRGGGGFDRGGSNWNGERGGGGWRPRRPWGGPSPGRGRGNW